MKSYSLTNVRYESIWVFYYLQNHIIVAGYLDSATLFYHFIIFLNAALQFAGHLFLVPKYCTLFCLWNNFSRKLQSFSFHDVKGFKKGLRKVFVLVLSMARYSSCPLLWASRSRCSMSQTGTGVAVIQPRAQRWAHRQPYYHRRTLCSFPRREGNFRPKLDWIYRLW